MAPFPPANKPRYFSFYLEPEIGRVSSMFLGLILRADLELVNGAQTPWRSWPCFSHRKRTFSKRVNHLRHEGSVRGLNRGQKRIPFWVGKHGGPQTPERRHNSQSKIRSNVDFRMKVVLCGVWGRISSGFSMPVKYCKNLQHFRAVQKVTLSVRQCGSEAGCSIVWRLRSQKTLRETGGT
jgi:hypothetical protein